MKIKLTALAIPLLIALSASSVHAQYDFRKGYIVTNESDTIQGYLDYANPSKNSGKCFFKKEMSGTIDRYTPNDLKGYAFSDSKIYVSKIVPLEDSSGLFFAEYLFEGVIDLYYVNDEGLDHYYAEKEGKLYHLSNDKIKQMVNDKEYVANSKNYIGLLLFLMQDAESLNGKINRTELNVKSLVNIAKEYHNQVCDSVQCVVYYRKEQKLNDNKWRIKFGLSVEYSYSSIKTDSYMGGRSYGIPNGEIVYDFVVKESNGRFVSEAGSIVSVLFLNIRRNNRTSLQLEAKYQVTKHPYIELSELKIPILFNYEFMYYKNPRPYFSVGIVNDLVVKTKVNDLYFKYGALQFSPGSNNYYYINYDENVNESALDHTYFNLRFCLGFGIKYDLGESAIKIEARGETAPTKKYSYSLNNAPLVVTEIRNSNVSLSVNYIF